MEPQAPHTHSYEAVAAGAASQILGLTGAVGDYIERLIVTVTTSATGNVTLEDGNGGAMPITAVNTPIGVYPVELRMRARNATTPGWKVTTGAGASAIGVGKFT